MRSGKMAGRSSEKQEEQEQEGGKAEEIAGLGQIEKGHILWVFVHRLQGRARADGFERAGSGDDDGRFDLEACVPML